MRQEPNEPQRGPLRTRLAWAIAFAPSLGFLAIALAPPMNHDVAAILAFAGRWLDGEGLYTDLLDVNPPLIFLVTAVPAAIGDWTPIGPVLALQLAVLGLCAASAGLALRLRPPGTSPVTAAALAAALPLLALAGGYEFGQREHLMAVAALPYLMLAARRAAGEGATVPRGLALGVALLAACGFALKPHFLAIPALVEALVLLRRGRAASRDPVPWVMAAAWLAYLAAIALLFPAYPDRVLPLIRAHYLGLGDLAWWQVALGERLGTTLLALLPLALLAFRRGGGGTLAQVLALAATGAAIGAIVQQKGWDYHILPARLFTGMLAVTLAARWLDGALPAVRARAAAPGLAAAGAWALAAFLVTGAAAPWRELRWPTSDGAVLARAVEAAAAGRNVLVLSPYIDPVFQALAYADARFTLPAMTIWPLQGAYGGDLGCPSIAGGARYRAPEAMPPEEAVLFQGVARAFAADPPAAVLVALNPRIGNCGRGFDLIGYFARHPLFAATFRRYRAGPVVAGHRLYTRLE